MITEFKEYLNTTKVYLPLTDTDYKIANVKVEEGQLVQVGEVVAYKFKGRKKLPIISSVSGTVIGFEIHEDRFGKKVDHMIIENDQKYNSIELQKIEEPSSSQIRNRIQDFGLETITVDGSYTNLEFERPIKHVVINAVFVYEPAYTIDYFYLQDHAEEIATGISYIKEAALAETATLILDKRMPKEVLEVLGKAIVDKNIQLYSMDPHLMKTEDIHYIKSLVKKDITPDLLESGVLYTDVFASKMVFDVMNGTVPSSRQVVFSGDGIKSNAIYEVRFGTRVSEIVEDLGGYNDVDDMVLHIGDFLTGRQVTSDELVITQSTDAFNFQEYAFVEEDVCIKCGDCNDVCPAGILPQNIMDAELRSVKDRIVELKTDLCIECGLCSYVCPSKINVLEWVRRAKRRVG